ncbi:MAG: ABC transporter permease [Puniceicoccales bacterium]|jgi:lipopolysaccharide transport system permease protein|nr:ABC transporter permease [Puniceicoccales bacterium]
MHLQTFKRYLGIIFYRTVAGIKSESRQRYLGYVWFLLEPLLSTAVFYVAYSQFTGHQGPGAVLLILVGMILWQWFEGGIMSGAGSIKSKFHVLNQCALPKFLFPLVSIAIHTWKFLCVSGVIFTVAIALGYTPNANWCYLPLLFLLQLLFIVSIALPISIGITLWTDFQIVVSSTLRLFFFLSGIFFEADKVPEDLQKYFFWNPMAVFIDSGRAVVLRGEAPVLERLQITVGATVILLLLSFVAHAYYDKKILKLINL